MILSADLLTHLVSDEYDQAQLLQQRRELLTETLVTAHEHLTQNEEHQSTAVMDAYHFAAEKLQSTMDHQGGVCQCLVLQWLKLKMAERAQNLSGRNKVDPSTRMHQLSSAAALDRAVDAQQAAAEGQLFTEKLEIAEAQYSMTTAGTATLGGSIANVANQVCARTHGYFLFGFSIEGGAHAIGFYQSGGSMFSSKHVYLFDPNIGELKFKSSEFATMLATFLEGTYQVENDQGTFETRVLSEYSA